MTVSAEQMSVSETSYSQDIMDILPNDWWQLIENFAVSGS
jgi:hypothetical protein